MDRLIYRVSAFPKGNKGGNEAGVVLETEGLDEKEMQKIATHVGYSETAFLFPSDKADYKVRYFSPKTEVPLCGHATIALFNLMRNIDALDKDTYTIETKAGILNIKIKEDSVLMEMGEIVIEDGPSFEDVQEILGLEATCILSKDIKQVGTGIMEIFVEVDSLKTLHTLNLDPVKVQSLCERIGCKGIYVFTEETEDASHATQGRNFLPVIGINEESATGTASGALAVYLREIKGIQAQHFVFEQGNVLGKPSLIEVDLHLENDRISTLYVGGGMRFIDKIVKYA